jgi:ketosteroid isomerase-like protein
MGQAAKVVNEYLNAFYTGDVARAQAVVAGDFSFKGPFVTTEGRSEFFESAARLTALVRGHRLLRQWTDGDDVASVFELKLAGPRGSGTVLMSEWHTVRGDELARGSCLFDSAAFRALVATVTTG